MKDNGLLFLLLGVGGLVWYASSKSASAASGPPTAPGSHPAGAPSNLPPAGSLPSHAYSGPSLAKMYAALQTAALQGYQDGDSNIACAGMSGLGAAVAGGGRAATGTVLLRDPSPVRVTDQPIGSRFHDPVQSPAPVSCSSLIAIPDVWSWYLTNRANVGVSSVPSSDIAFPGQVAQQISLSEYWAGMAPLLQKQIAGLQGFFELPPMLPLRQPAHVNGMARSYPHGSWGR